MVTTRYMMLSVLAAILAGATPVAGAQSAQNGGARTHPSDMTLWYRQPAAVWTEALPIGNGHIGAMVFGGVEEERIQFNEDTVWSGRPHQYQHEGAAQYLAEIRRLLSEGRQREAEDLASRVFMSVPLRQKAYQPLGDLRLRFTSSHNYVAGYQRSLDLETAVTRVEYRGEGGSAFRREAFASHPDDVIVIRIQALGRSPLNFNVFMDSPHDDAVSKIAGDRLILSGRVEEGGVRFEARLAVIAEGGPGGRFEGHRIAVRGARTATLLLTAASSFRTFHDHSGDPSARCEQIMKQVELKPYGQILGDHTRDYQNLFSRVRLDLGRSATADLPTDERLRNIRQAVMTARRSRGAGAVAGIDQGEKYENVVIPDPDPALSTLFFQFGRYLMISSSRPGGQPANLQGLWNNLTDPPWDSKWTTNINTEMNYWMAEPTNLSECHQPLFDMIDDLVISGRLTAKAHYGIEPGWVLHHNTDIWRGTAPINASNHGIWVTGSGWLCQHLWERYQFTLDRNFLKHKAYPVMKEASQFYAAFLVKDPRTGWLISTPSNSPEQGGLVAGPTMDHQIIRWLFQATSQAARILGEDEDLARRLDELRPQIAPNQVGRHGQLQEWFEDRDDPQNTHRHVSHLWGLFPGSEITPDTPRFFEAARRTLIQRGDGGTGWSKAWKINFWARLLDGDHAHKMLIEALANNTFDNLFDSHPPFQIDGNFGAVNGVAEMLLQGQNGVIDLLPALPSQWAAGSVRGLRARGGFELDFAWKDSKLTRGTIRSVTGTAARVRYAGKAIELNLKPGESRSLEFGGKALTPQAAENSYDPIRP